MKNKNTDPGLMGVSSTVVRHINPEWFGTTNEELIEFCYNDVYQCKISREDLRAEHAAKARYTTGNCDLFPDFFISSPTFHKFCDYILRLCSTFTITYSPTPETLIYQQNSAGSLDLRFDGFGSSQLPSDKDSLFPSIFSNREHFVLWCMSHIGAEAYVEYIRFLKSIVSPLERELLDRVWGSDWGSGSAHLFFASCWDNWMEANPEFKDQILEVAKSRFEEFEHEFKSYQDQEYSTRIYELLSDMESDGYSFEEIQKFISSVVVSRVHNR